MAAYPQASSDDCAKTPRSLQPHGRVAYMPEALYSRQTPHVPDELQTLNVPEKLVGQSIATQRVKCSVLHVDERVANDLRYS